MPAPAAPPADPAAASDGATEDATDEPWVPKPTVAFPATGLGEYRMPADAETVVLKTEAEVYRMDLDLIREHWDELSDDELVEQAVREYAAMLGRKQLLAERIRFHEDAGTKLSPSPFDDPVIEAVDDARATSAADA